MGKILDINADKEIKLFEGDIFLNPHRKKNLERNVILDPSLK